MRTLAETSLFAVALLLQLSVVLQASAQGGMPLWTNRYNGPGNGYDSAQAIAVDAGGNVFVTGISYASGTGEDSATIKYSSAGMPLWTNRYTGLGGNAPDHATAIAVDSSGNVAVTGISIGSDPGVDFATVKYSNDGAPLWANRYAGNGDLVSAVAMDTNGNVFVTGSVHGSNGSSDDYATLKYSSAGVPLWTNRYNGPANTYDYAYALAVDPSGNVIVTGGSAGSGSFGDYATIKYSNAGATLWTKRYNGPANGDDMAKAIAVDSSGNVFVTGYSTGSGGNYDYATIKYSGAGVSLWTNRYNGTGNGDDQAAAIAVDAIGNVTVTGNSTGIGGNLDYLTINYSNAGVPLWTNRYNGPGNSDDSAAAVAIDASGNVFVTGYDLSGSSIGQDYATIAYSGAGLPLWTNRYNGPENGTDRANGIAVDSSGNVFVTGGSSANSDYVTIEYSSSVLSPIPLSVRFGSNQLILSWTNSAFNLQSAPEASGQFTNIPAATSPFTNPITDPQQFFRLKGN